MKYSRKRIVAAIMSFAMMTGMFTYFPANTNLSFLSKIEVSAEDLGDINGSPSQSEPIENGDGTFSVDVEDNGTFTYTATDGKATITAWTGEVTDITIPATLGGNTVTAIGAEAFAVKGDDDNFTENPTLTAVVIPEGVTLIEESAFRQCTALTSIDIPDSVTSLGDWSFYNCTSLKEVNFGENSQLQTINTYAFADCAELVSIEIPASVTSIGRYAFGRYSEATFTGVGCKKLASITFAEGSQLTTLGATAFNYCTALQSITIPGGVTSIGLGTFMGCEKLKNVVISEGMLTITGYAFDDCISLKTIYLPKTLSEIHSNSFSSCGNIQTVYGYDPNIIANIKAPSPSVSFVDLNDFGVIAKNKTAKTAVISEYRGTESDIVYPEYIEGCKVTEIYAYEFVSPNEDLKSVVIPAGITTIRENAFLCPNLTKAVILNPDCVIVAGAFSTEQALTFYGLAGSTTEDYVKSLNNPNITFVTLNDISELDYIIDEDGVITAYSGSAEELVIPSVIQGIEVTAIGDDAFEYHTELTSVVIPDSVTSIGLNVFGACSKLMSVTLPDSLISIGTNSFQFCYSLTNITLPDSITTLGDSVFTGCRTLETVNIPDNDSLTEIPYSTFGGCSALQTITIPDGITSIGEQAFRSTGLTSVIIPESVTSIDDNAFLSCNSLTEIKGYSGTAAGTLAQALATILGCTFVDLTQGFVLTKDTDTKTATISGYTGNATDLTIPEYIGSYQITAIADNVFKDNTTLTTIRFTDCLETIGDSAFQGCTDLWYVSLPENSKFTTIPNYAFYGCTSLSDINIPDNVTEIGVLAFGDCSILSEIYIIAETLAIDNCAANAFDGTSEDLVIYGYEGSNVKKYAEMCDKNYYQFFPFICGTANDETGIIIHLYESYLTDVVIPEKINDLPVVAIGAGAFGQGSLAALYITSVKIPASVTLVGESAFEGCADLTEVIIYSKITDFGEDVFTDVSENLIIYGYAGSDVEKYAEENGINFVSIDSLQTQAGELLTALGDEKYAPLNIYADIQTALTTYANIANSTDISELNNAITVLSTLNTNAENALIITEKQGELATLVTALRVYLDDEYKNFVIAEKFDIDTIAKGFEAYLTSESTEVLEAQITAIESEIAEIETAYSEYVASSTTKPAETTAKPAVSTTTTTSKSSAATTTTAKPVVSTTTTTAKPVVSTTTTTAKPVVSTTTTTAKPVVSTTTTTSKSGATTTSKSVDTTTSKSGATTTSKSVATTSKSVATTTSKSVATTTSKPVVSTTTTTSKSGATTTSKPAVSTTTTTSKSVATTTSTSSITDPIVTTTSTTGGEEATTTSTTSSSTTSTTSSTTTKVTVAVKLDSMVKKVSPTSAKVFVERTEGNAKGAISYILLKGDYSNVDFSTAKLADMKNHADFVKLEYSNWTKNFNFNITHLDPNTTYTLVPFTVKMKYGYFGMGENVTFTTPDISLTTTLKTVTADTAKFKISRTGSANGALGYVLLKGDVSDLNYKTLEEYKNSENFLANQTSNWTGAVTVTVKGIESGETYTVVPYTQKGNVCYLGLGENTVFTAE